MYAAFLIAITSVAFPGNAGVVAWFKADGISGVADGAPVTVWPDVSGRGGHAQTSTPPTLAANAINGRAAVRFDGAQSQYLSFPRPVQDDFTMFVVFRSTQGSGGSGAFYDAAGIVNGEVGGVTNDFGTAFSESGRVVVGTGNPDTSVRSVSGLNDGQPHVFAFRRVRESGTIGVYVDDLQGVTNSDAGKQALTAPSKLVIGAQQTLINFFTGDIAEIIIYDEALSGSQRQSIRSALYGKYGLAGGAAPSTPTGVTTSQSLVQWEETVGAASYEVSRATSPDGPFEVVASGLKTSSWVDPEVVAGGTFYYTVKATNAVGTSPASEPAKAVIPVLPANGRVIINEIHYNGLNNAVRSDFIELYNYKSTPTDLSGWRISSAIDYTFPPGTVIPPGGYLVVAEDPAKVQALWGVEALGPFTSGSLSSDGETIRLRDTTNAIVSEVTYSSGFPWPCAANGEGASAELINPTLNPTLGSSWRASTFPASSSVTEKASPGFQNHQYVENPPPNVETVIHSPRQPTSSDPITITARITDTDGVASVQLHYQILTAGNYIPAYLPNPTINGQIAETPLQPNPAFEDPANWTTVVMNDAGVDGDVAAGDGFFTGKIPAQPNRTLVRYRITATDSSGQSVHAPMLDDESKNFACFVYNGVPDYQGIPASTLETLPVYHFITRKQDYDHCVAYTSNYRINSGASGWSWKNWEAAIVFEGTVYDHIRYRLHGGNGRYSPSGASQNFSIKRAFRFFFNPGYDFQNRDNDGNLYPTKWNSLTTENLWENRGTLTYSLNEVVNFHLWNVIGVPAPKANWGHFRTIMQAEEQPDAWHGDFWGLMLLHEDYDRRFLDSHNLEKGNLYKLTRDATDGPSQQRYQAPLAVTNGSDHANIRNNLRGSSTAEFINSHVNLERWSYYHALCQAVRHYDYWPSGDNNAAYYFEPVYTPQNNYRGKLWVLPNDVDATWGPTWNNGHDIVYNSLFDASGSPGGDPFTTPSLWPVYFNAVREVRDLLWQPDQINPLIDEFAAVIAPFVEADGIRWKGAPADAGNYNSLTGSPGYTSLAALVADMKKFAWQGGNWPGGAIQAGGTASFLDTLQLGVSNSEGSTKPLTPTLTYVGSANHPVNDLKFQASAFSDPQGANTFAAVQWRIAEVTDPSAPAYNPADKHKLEWISSYDSGPLPTVAAPFKFPASACKPGHAYRARVRYQDNTGRWSNWSAPVQFIAGAAIPEGLTTDLVITEFLYAPLNPTPAETAAGFSIPQNFEYIELTNVGNETLNLSGVRFSKGIEFVFPNGTQLAPNERLIVASNPAGFTFRFGGGKTVLGPWDGNLNNSGEQILLETSNGMPIVDFTYSDDPPWPREADTDGYSLVLIKPHTRPDPNLASNWRIGATPGGSPGEPDDVNFENWAEIHSIVTGPDGDDDNDGIPNRLEYAFHTDPKSPNAYNPPVISALNVGGQTADYLTITFDRLVNAQDITYRVETSTTLSDWQATPVLVESVNNRDGSVTETWRTPQPVNASDRSFLRARVLP